MESPIKTLQDPDLNCSQMQLKLVKCECKQLWFPLLHVLSVILSNMHINYFLGIHTILNYVLCIQELARQIPIVRKTSHPGRMDEVQGRISTQYCVYWRAEGSTYKHKLIAYANSHPFTYYFFQFIDYLSSSHFDYQQPHRQISVHGEIIYSSSLNEVELLGFNFNTAPSFPFLRSVTSGNSHVSGNVIIKIYIAEMTMEHILFRHTCLQALKEVIK